MKRKNKMSKGKPTYNDFRDASPKELIKTYGINYRQLDKAQRAVNPGASQSDLRKEAEKFYPRNKQC
jgi:hypothetical protein